MTIGDTGFPPHSHRNFGMSKIPNVCWDLGMLDFALLEMLEFLDSQNSAKGKRNLCRNFGTPGQLEFMSKILGKKQSHQNIKAYPSVSPHLPPRVSRKGKKVFCSFMTANKFSRSTLLWLASLWLNLGSYGLDLKIPPLKIERYTFNFYSCQSSIGLIK